MERFFILFRHGVRFFFCLLFSYTIGYIILYLHKVSSVYSIATRYELVS